MSEKKTPPEAEKDSESTDIESDIEEIESSNVNESDEINADSSEENILDPLEEATKEAAHWKDLAARNQAELDNYRKRMAREKSDAIKFANGSLLSELLPVIDSLDDCEGLVVASGFSGHGFGIAPAVGGIVSDLVLNKKTRLPIDPFSFHRFQNHLISEEKSELTLHG